MTGHVQALRSQHGHTPEPAASTHPTAATPEHVQARNAAPRLGLSGLVQVRIEPPTTVLATRQVAWRHTTCCWHMRTTPRSLHDAALAPAVSAIGRRGRPGTTELATELGCGATIVDTIRSGPCVISESINQREGPGHLPHHAAASRTGRRCLV